MSDHEKQAYLSAEEMGLEDLIEQVDRPPEPDEEVGGYIERVEKKGEDHSQQIPADDQGQPLVRHTQQPPALPKDAVILPMTQQQFEEGIHAPFIKAARWLAVWCEYIIKKFGEKVFFRG